MSIKKRIRVTYKRLTKVNGWSYGNGSVEIDSRLKGKKLLEILIHECMHEVFPEKEEDEIEKKAAIITRTLWHEGFRKIDNDGKHLMQDELK